MQIAASAVGIFSLYESRLQSTYGWPKPFEEVQRLMKSAALGGEERFEDFRLAVNVLKHGKGPSHTRLLARANRLPFKVQSLFGELHEEGDVCPHPTSFWFQWNFCSFTVTQLMRVGPLSATR